MELPSKGPTSLDSHVRVGVSVYEFWREMQSAQNKSADIDACHEKGKTFLWVREGEAGKKKGSHLIQIKENWLELSSMVTSTNYINE